jgi:uncharacterized membrane protein YhhN
VDHTDAVAILVGACLAAAGVATLATAPWRHLGDPTLGVVVVGGALATTALGATVAWLGFERSEE